MLPGVLDMSLHPSHSPADATYLIWHRYGKSKNKPFLRLHIWLVGSTILKNISQWDRMVNPQL